MQRTTRGRGRKAPVAREQPRVSEGPPPAEPPTTTTTTTTTATDEVVAVPSGEPQQPLQPQSPAPLRQSTGGAAARKEAISVYLRVRPLSSEELEANEQEAVHLASSTFVTAKPPEDSATYKSGDRNEARFGFTHVFDAQAGQKTVFEDSTIPLLRNFMLGQNGLLFAYGKTNAGKTYTISGSENRQGILPRTIDMVFNSILAAQEGDEAAIAEGIANKTLLQVEAGYRYFVFVSYLEIYNEQVYDLLSNEERQPLTLQDDQKGRVLVKGLTEVLAKSAAQAKKLLRRGMRNRQVAETALNADSSRSHSMFRIKLIRLPPDITSDQMEESRAEMRLSSLAIVDLAGSERSNKTNTAGVRAKEASKINTSLMTFGKCIETLKYNQTHQNKLLPPFRESKLTRLCQEYFTGAGKAVMLVCISPGAADYDETINTLKFSATAREVTTTTRIDTGRRRMTTDSQSLVGMKRSLSSAMLPLLATTATPGGGGNTASHAATEQLKQELERMREELMLVARESMQHESELEESIRAEMAEEFATRLSELEQSYELRLKEEVMLLEEKAEFKIANILRAQVMHSTAGGSSAIASPGMAASDRRAYEMLYAEHLENSNELRAIAEERDRLQLSIEELRVQLNTNQFEKDQLLDSIRSLNATVQSLQEQIFEMQRAGDGSLRSSSSSSSSSNFNGMSQNALLCSTDSLGSLPPAKRPKRENSDSPSGRSLHDVALQSSTENPSIAEPQTPTDRFKKAKNNIKGFLSSTPLRGILSTKRLDENSPTFSVSAKSLAIDGGKATLAAAPATATAVKKKLARNAVSHTPISKRLRNRSTTTAK